MSNILLIYFTLFNYLLTVKNLLKVHESSFLNSKKIEQTQQGLKTLVKLQFCETSFSNFINLKWKQAKVTIKTVSLNIYI